MARNPMEQPPSNEPDPDWTPAEYYTWLRKKSSKETPQQELPGGLTPEEKVNREKAIADSDAAEMAKAREQADKVFNPKPSISEVIESAEKEPAVDRESVLDAKIIAEMETDIGKVAGETDLALKPEGEKKLDADLRLKQLNEMRNRWNNAEKIDKVLKTGGKIKTEGGSLSAENDREKLQKMVTENSDEIIKIAGEIAGEDLIAKAKEETGYKFSSGDKEKQKEFRTLLTKEVKRIFKESVRALEESTGKKVKKVADKKIISGKKVLAPDVAPEAASETPVEKPEPAENRPEEKVPAGSDDILKKEVVAGGLDMDNGYDEIAGKAMGFANAEVKKGREQWVGKETDIMPHEFDLRDKIFREEFDRLWHSTKRSAEEKPVLENLETAKESGEENIEREFLEDCERGAVGWYISTKIPHGKTFAGKMQPEGGAVEMYEPYTAPSAGGKIDSLIGSYSMAIPDHVWEHEEKGDAAVSLQPIYRHEKVVEKQEKEVGWLWKRKKIVEEVKDKKMPALLKDFGMEGLDGEEQFYSLTINYMNSGGGNYVEKRKHVTSMSVTMPMSLAKKVFDGIKNDPASMWKFIELAEPQLLELTSPTGDKNNPKIIVQSPEMGSKYEIAGKK